MSAYVPDVWVAVRFRGAAVPNGEIHKILAGWYGGFAGSDHWKLNSGITGITREDHEFLVEGYSGSIYRCAVGAERTNLLTQGIYQDLCERFRDREVTVEIVPLSEVCL